VLDTISRLEASGIAFCGIGRNRQEARSPAIVECKGIKIGFLSYTSVYWPVGHAAEENAPGVATMKIHTSYEPGRRALEMPGASPSVVTIPDTKEFAALQVDIQNLSSRADIVAVSFHWGISSSFELADYQRTVGHAAVDAGADVVIGHHPHVPQGVEVYRGKPIFYSLGNFVFDWAKMEGRHLAGLLVRALIREGKLGRVSFVPTRRNDQNNVEILDASGDVGRKTVDRVKDLSAEFKTDVRVEGHEAIVGLEEYST
jgi:poly-gamma-glutamate synthesis protein (capsule biosynthesis protein)